MGLIDRIKRISVGRIEAFLAAVESPEAVLPVLLEELAGRLNQATNAQAKALSAVKSAQRRLDEMTGRASRMQQGARLALETGDVDLARQALAAQLDAERTAQQRNEELERAQQAYIEATAARKMLAGQIQQLRRQSREVIQRAKAARQARSAGQAIPVPRREQLLSAVARMEDKVAQDESVEEVRAEIARPLSPDLPERRLRELERDREVQRRLEALRRDVQGPG